MESAGLCLESVLNHESIVLFVKSFVNDIHQGGIVPIVLGGLYDKTL